MLQAYTTLRPWNSTAYPCQIVSHQVRSWSCFIALSMSPLNCVYIKILSIFRYEPTFFQDVVNGCDIVSWGAVDSSQPDGQSDELIGFVTARVVLAKESEVGPFVWLLQAVLIKSFSCLCITARTRWKSLVLKICSLIQPIILIPV